MRGGDKFRSINRYEKHRSGRKCQSIEIGISRLIQLNSILVLREPSRTLSSISRYSFCRSVKLSILRIL